MAYGASDTLVALLRRAGLSPAEIERFIRNAQTADSSASASDPQYTVDTGARSSSSSSSTDTGDTSPPFMSFDPALEAEQRALERGLENLLEDTARERHYATQDARQTRRDLRQDKRRGVKDIRRERRRGVEDIGVRRADVQRDATRGREDFGSRLSNLIVNFQQKGSQQYQAANAQGSLDASTMQASDAARAGGFARARAPIDTGLARLNENEQTALGQLATSEGRLLQDTGQAQHRLRQDVRHDVRLTDQQLKRQLRDIHTRRQRAREEEAIGQVDLTQQEIYQARQNNPGAFDTEGNRRNRNRRQR
jgi:hypothetical protein